MNLFVPIFLNLAFSPLLSADSTSVEPVYEIVVQSSSMVSDEWIPVNGRKVIHMNTSEISNSMQLEKVLSQVPGVQIARQGGSSQNSSVYIRGANAEDTLVLVDGVEVNDPISPSGGFDFSILSIEQIERVEIYYGPQGVRFGAGALGGVINFITKKGSEIPVTVFKYEAGSYNSQNIAVAHLGKIKKVGYSLGANYSVAEGPSAAKAGSGGEEDASELSAGSLKLTYTTHSGAKIDTTLGVSNLNADIDSSGGPSGDDPNYQSDSEQRTGGISASQKFFSGSIKSTIGYFVSELQRSTKNTPDEKNSSFSRDKFSGINQKVRIDLEFLKGDFHAFKTAGEYRDESGFSNSNYDGALSKVPKKNQSTSSLAFIHAYDNSNWLFDWGVRTDDNSLAGSIFSYQLAVGKHWLKNRGKTLISSGSGFKLPSLYQLYSQYGQKNLIPEESKSLDLSNEVRIGSGFVAGLSVFENQFQNLIDFDTTNNRYQNLKRARVRGYEIYSRVELSDLWEFEGSYSHQKSIDTITRQNLLRRPKHNLNISAKRKMKKVEATLLFNYRGKRDDLDPQTFKRKQLSDYNLIGVDLGYRLNKSLKVTSRIENATDINYEEVAGYGTAGRSFIWELWAPLIDRLRTMVRSVSNFGEN